MHSERHVLLYGTNPLSRLKLDNGKLAGRDPDGSRDPYASPDPASCCVLLSQPHAAYPSGILGVPLLPAVPLPQLPGPSPPQARAERLLGSHTLGLSPQGSWHSGCL